VRVFGARIELRLSSVGILSQCSDEIAYSAGCTENSREPTSGIINGVFARECMNYPKDNRDCDPG